MKWHWCFLWLHRVHHFQSECTFKGRLIKGLLASKAKAHRKVGWRVSHKAQGRLWIGLKNELKRMNCLFVTYIKFSPVSRWITLLSRARHCGSCRGSTRRRAHCLMTPQRWGGVGDGGRHGGSSWEPKNAHRQDKDVTAAKLQCKTAKTEQHERRFNLKWMKWHKKYNQTKNKITRECRLF